MTKEAVRYVLCDVGSVLVLADHQRTHQVLEQYGVPPDHARKFFDNPDYAAFAVGEIDADQFYNRLIQNHLCFELTKTQVVAAHHTQIYQVDEAVVHMVRQITVPVAIATSTNDWQDARMAELIDIESFGRVFKSSDMGMLKTDRGMLTQICDLLNTPAINTLLIDDNQKVIDQAMSEGLQTHLFRDANSLEADLLERSLIS